MSKHASHGPRIAERSQQPGVDAALPGQASSCQVRRSQGQTSPFQGHILAGQRDILPELCLGVLCKRHPDKAELLSMLVADDAAWKRLQKMANEAFGMASLDRCLRCSRAYPLCCVVQTEFHTPYRSKTKLSSDFNLPISFDALVTMAEAAVTASNQPTNSNR